MTGIGKVPKGQGMVVIGPIGLDERVRFAQLQSERWIDIAWTAFIKVVVATVVFVKKRVRQSVSTWSYHELGCQQSQTVSQHLEQSWNNLQFSSIDIHSNIERVVYGHTNISRHGSKEPRDQQHLKDHLGREEEMIDLRLCWRSCSHKKEVFVMTRGEDILFFVMDQRAG
jgi:hypothetical protein